jgi:hypothetical protein
MPTSADGPFSDTFAFLRIAVLEAGDPLEHQLRDRSVLAHDDEQRRHPDAGEFRIGRS